MKEKRNMCCYKRLDGIGCGREAEFKIVYGNEVSDVTESCASHIGHLVDDKIERFEVIRIPRGFQVGDTVKICAALEGAPDEIYKVIRNTDGKLALDDVMGTALDELKPEAINLVEECEICHGKGSTIDHHDPCSNCGGDGFIK